MLRLFVCASDALILALLMSLLFKRWSCCGPHLRPLIGFRFASNRVPFGRGGSPNKDALLYSTAAVLVTLAGTYAAVPLYRIYCQSTGKGGQAFADATDKVETMKPDKQRPIRIKFEADTGSMMAWNFKPLQSELIVVPGETALAFYSASNPRPKPVIGVATYSVQPYEAGLYLNKIQCFCFEEQRLNPNERVEMPVFFYIDPDYSEDPRLEDTDSIVLSYFFFESKDDLKLPIVEKMQNLLGQTASQSENKV